MLQAVLDILKVNFNNLNAFCISLLSRTTKNYGLSAELPALNLIDTFKFLIHLFILKSEI